MVLIKKKGRTDDIGLHIDILKQQKLWTGKNIAEMTKVPCFLLYFGV